jgi:DNA repair exonuclease SbcCD nuclease subunit
MIQFIHSSDWHVGASVGCFDREMRKRLIRARLLAVEAIFMAAQREGVSLVLCAGDAMDNGQLTGIENLDALFAVFNRYPGIKVVMVPGVHDPLTANSVYLRMPREKYPANVHLAGDREMIPVPGMNLNIFAAPAEKNQTHINPFQWVKPTDIDKTKINIALTHGDISDEIIDQLANTFDYLALGGRHTHAEISPRAYYCGTPEALDFTDNGCPLKVIMEKPNALPRVDPITGIPQYRWQSLTFELSDHTFDDFKKTFQAIEDREIRRAQLTGKLSLENYQSYKETLQTHRRLYYEIDDQVSLDLAEADLSGIDDGYTRGLIRHLIDLKKNDDPLPEEITNGVVPAAQLEVEQTLGIHKNQIIDAAITKTLDYLKQNGT